MTFPALPPLHSPVASGPLGVAAAPVQAAFEQPPALWVIGDIHGSLGKMQRLMQRGGLLDAQLRWQGGAAHLVCMGDYLDRGENGAGVVRFIRTLQRQAQEAGGCISALLGNHEVMLLAALKFRAHDPNDDLGFFRLWQRNGGLLSDLAELEPGDLAWMRRCPAMLQVGYWLFQHADSLMYQQLGADIDTVNASMARRLQSVDPYEWRELIGLFTTRMAYSDSIPEGLRNAEGTLLRYRSRRLVHGHTPVQAMFKARVRPGLSLGPQVYAGGLCLNVDSGMAYDHSSGFMVQLGRVGLEKIVNLE